MSNSSLIEAAIEAVAERLIEEIHTAIPAEVIKQNSDGTIDVVIDIITKGDDGELLEPPALYNIPVIENRVGALKIEAPIQPGDKVLLIISELDIDAWKQNKTRSVADDPRRFSLNDAIAIAGLPNTTIIAPRTTRIIDTETGMNIEFKKDRISINGGSLEVLK